MRYLIGRLLGYVVGAFKFLWRGAIDRMQWLRGLLRRRPHYIEERWQGVPEGAIDGKVCVFVHFDRKGMVHDYVLFYLEALRAAGFKIVFVTNSARLDPDGLLKLRLLAHLVLRRSNVGYDFGAYKDAIAMIPDMNSLDMLLLANDSVYGPFSPIADLLSGLDQTRAQFWGLTDSWESAYHLQSYFLLFSGAALRNPAFGQFWRSVRYINAKRYVIRHYELGLSRQLMKAGLRGAALFSMRAASRGLIDEVDAGALDDPTLDHDSKDYLKRMHAVVERGVTLNISHFFWDRLILKMGCPFLKRELLEKNPVAVPYVSRWQEVIGAASDYDTDLITRHLEMTMRNRVA
jgi:lipopolysaccharide biosynthesis protein